MNTLDTLRQQARQSQQELTIEDVRSIIERLSPNELNSLILDREAPVRRYEYCYIYAKGQRVIYKTELRTVACDKNLEEQINELANTTGENPFVMLSDDKLIEALDNAPKFNAEGILGNARKKMSELVKGDTMVDHTLVRLTMEDGWLTERQPSFIIKKACKTEACPHCQGQQRIKDSDKNGVVTMVDCNACNGMGRIATVAYITPRISNNGICIIRSKDNVFIDNLKDSVFEDHKGEDTTPCRMATHVNGIDKEDYDKYITPYLEQIHDQLGEDNALEDIYYHLVPCYQFQYRNVVTGDLEAAILIDPFEKPMLIFNLASTSSKIGTGIRDTMKGIGKFLGKVSNSRGNKERNDLMRSIRLMIAVTVADGKVSETEKQSLVNSIQGMKSFSSTEQQALIELLNGANSSFLTDDDFLFRNADTAKTTLIRLQQIAAAHDPVCDAERDIIERLRLSI